MRRTRSCCDCCRWRGACDLGGAATPERMTAQPQPVRGSRGQTANEENATGSGLCRRSLGGAGLTGRDRCPRAYAPVERRRTAKLQWGIVSNADAAPSSVHVVSLRQHFDELRSNDLPRSLRHLELWRVLHCRRPTYRPRLGRSGRRPPHDLHHRVLAQAHVTGDEPIGQSILMQAKHPLGFLV
jgi:hypothetical protein